MEKLDYLKNHLQTNIPLTVRIVKRVGQYPETDYNTGAKTGRMQTLYNFELPSGEKVRHYAKEREEETLGHFQAGEEVRVVRQEADKNGKRITFLVWTDLDGAEARLAANPPVRTNLQETASKRELKERKDEQDEMWAKKDIAATLGMLTKMFYDDFDDKPDLADRFLAALALAKVCRPEFQKAINKCFLEDKTGIPSVPQSKTSLKEVEELFANSPTEASLM